ncbi:hypothetical protein J2T17_007472 [Paenibacillus mucilaginosus]|uniref:hypothetical protein n=1 Tax=Paenibacillus mucilaginosus TaxID=61624 RepID=UPI003D1CDD15
MMKLKKVVASLAVSAILSSLAVVGASAADAGVAQRLKTPPTTGIGGGGYTPQTVDKTWDENFGGGSTDDDVFNIRPGYGHVKIHVLNTASTPLKVNLIHRDTQFKYWETTIAANSPGTFESWDDGFAQGMMSGDYTITFSGGNYNVSGTYWGKSADSTGDFAS